MEGLPGHIADAIKKAIDEKTTYTEYLDGELNEELKALLIQRHLLIVRHPKDKGRYKLFVPTGFRVKYK